jgi:anti-sigma regulatory factor (Ser/Thr protein kinase)
MNCPPKTHQIQSWQEAPLPLKVILTEPGDNSIDWSATEIEYVADLVKKSLLITDNGFGIADPQQMLTSGDSPSTRDRLGRHGEGLKKIAARLGRRLYYESVTQTHKKLVKRKRLVALEEAERGRILTRIEKVELEQLRKSRQYFKITGDVDWEEVKKTDDWKYPDPVFTRVHPDATGKDPETYTKILITEVYPSRFNDISNMAEKLTEAYARFLRSGGKITLSEVRSSTKTITTQLIAPPLPALDPNSEVKGEYQTASGKKFHLHAGLATVPGTANHCVNLNYLYRSIEKWTPKFLAGCSTTDFHAEVELIDGKGARWTLASHKVESEASEKPELEAAIEPLLKGVLTTLQNKGLQIRIRELELFGAGILNAKSKFVRPPRTGSGNVWKWKSKSAGSSSKGEKSFRVCWEKGGIGKNLWRIQDTLATANELTLFFNEDNVTGNTLKTSKPAEVKPYILFALASYFVDFEDYHARFPFLLNGVDNLNEARILNLTHWFEHSDVV